MGWVQKTVQDWEDFTRIAADFARLTRPSRTNYLFRGQADSSWFLQPSFVRSVSGLSAKDALDIEDSAMSKFQEEAHLFVRNEDLPKQASNSLAWWMVMQHHRAPTRLLDWTSSLYVAAYFAAEISWSTNGAIWWFQARNMQRRMEESFGAIEQPLEKLRDPDAPNWMRAFTGNLKFQRMAAQQGAFTVCAQVLTDHADAIPPEKEGRTQYVKMIIPKETKPEFMTQLRQMNVTAGTLFPGIDGVGRAISELVQLESAHFRNQAAGS